VLAARRAMRQRLAANGASDESGFTLIELLIVIVILPIIVGAIATALLSVLNLHNTVTQRVSDSNDEQVASATFNRDVQSSQELTKQTTPGCGQATQTQLLGLEWDANTAAPGGYGTVISYVSVPVTNAQSGTTTYSLVRQSCTGGASTTPTSTMTVSDDIGPSPPTTVTITPATVDTNATTAWVTTQGVTQVAIAVVEPGSGYQFSLTGVPSQSNSTGSVSNFTQSSGPGCDFATPTSGTYAKQLCFADFTGFQGVTYPNTCQTMQRPIANTPFTLSFCISVTGTNVAPASIPTYYNPSGGNSEAYLGNNGFYTGIPGDPALYQTAGGITTAYITNIQVLDAAGNPASGWTLVTGDAESTDTNEWMVFQSNLNWSVLYNNGSADPYGNACYDTNDTNNIGVLNYTGPTPPTSNQTGSNGTLNSNVKGAQASLPATGTNSILCESNQQLNKTGTLMLEAQEPNGSNAAQSLTVTMRGSGLEAMFLGVLL
jgi:prepilin-type N-terminal cleavage/methylation domain-containing protein